MKVLNRIFQIILYLVYVIFWILTLIVLGFSLVTVIRFRQYEQNDLFDILRDNIPLLALSMLAVFALILAVLVLTGHRETAHLIHSPADSSGNIPKQTTDSSSIVPKHTIRATGNTGENRPDSRLASQYVLNRKPPFPWPMMLIAGGLSLFFVIVIHGRATNDALMLDQIMLEFASGDYSALNPGGYLFVYPFQIFYVLIGEVIQAACGPSNFMACQILNIVSILLNLYFLYQITWELFESRGVCTVMQILSVLCVFYYVYATFVYNDLWSFAAQTAAIYLQILYMKRRRAPGTFLYELGAGLCIALACLLKSNSYIALIAMVIMVIVDTVREGKSWRRFLTGALLPAALLILLTFGSRTIVHTAVAHAAGISSFPQGVPAVNYFAMGMQEAEGKYGWYNGTNVALYRDAGWDRAASEQAARESIQESVGEFRNSGRYFVRFYLGKFLSQWGDPTCVSMRELEESERHIDNVWPLADWLIFGTGSSILQWIMNVAHSMIYLGVTVYAGTVIFRRYWQRKKGKSDGRFRNWPVRYGSFRKDVQMDPDRPETSVSTCGEAGRLRERDKRKEGTEAGVSSAEELLVLMIFGGMIFHELWEASGRYTMRYYLTMLPLAAQGIHIMLDRLSGRLCSASGSSNHRERIRN